MNSDTCAVLAQILPVLLLVCLLEARMIRPKARRRPIVKQLMSGGFITAFLGTVAAVIGVEIGGYAWPWSLIPWALATIAAVCFFLVAALIAGTLELDADEAE